MTRELEEELKWVKEAEAAIEQRVAGQMMLVEIHRQRFPAKYRRYLELSSSEITEHRERLESDLEDSQGGFL